MLKGENHTDYERLKMKQDKYMMSVWDDFKREYELDLMKEIKNKKAVKDFLRFFDDSDKEDKRFKKLKSDNAKHKYLEKRMLRSIYIGLHTQEKVITSKIQEYPTQKQKLINDLLKIKAQKKDILPEIYKAYRVKK